jgi:hypothetical protein
MLQQLLDSTERSPSLAGRQTQHVFEVLSQAPEAPAIPGLPALEQLALDPARQRSAECERNLAGARSNGLDLARFLPLEAPDLLGRLDGDVVFVRDHRDRNALLRERFADRRWYRARVSSVDGRMTATISDISDR